MTTLPHRSPLILPLDRADPALTSLGVEEVWDEPGLSGSMPGHALRLAALAHLAAAPGA